jgi:hypothetical protein
VIALVRDPRVAVALEVALHRADETWLTVEKKFWDEILQSVMEEEEDEIHLALS